MKILKITTTGNITYSGLTYDTQLIIEYKHTGKEYRYKEKRTEKCTNSESIADEKRSKGINVTEKEGYYYIDRIAIPTVNAAGNNDIWYITNEGDNYKINSISESEKEIHKQIFH